MGFLFVACYNQIMTEKKPKPQKPKSSAKPKRMSKSARRRSKKYDTVPPGDLDKSNIFA